MQARQAVDRWAPGLAALLRYRREDALPDLRAGLAVAAVAVPVGIAYAELAGFRPEVGLYCSIFPLVAYAVFGSSRQLIVGPDAATCAVVAASITPLAGADVGLYAALSGMLALLTGLICVAASFLRLGMLADFLSKPILVGFLNGIAITIVIGQFGKILGLPVTASGLFPVLLDLAARIGDTHLPTLAVGLGAVAILVVAPRFVPWLPAGILAMGGGALAVAFGGLDALGVKTLGVVPSGLPHWSLPLVDPAFLPSLLPDAAALALVSFTSMMLSSRSFAAKNGYDVDPDQDFAALGASNVLSGLTQGFAVSGADSRTAMSDAAGGRTHATGLVAALAVGLVLLFLTHPLQYVPVAALGAVLVFAGISLVDVGTLRFIYRADRVEAAISLLATAGVVGLGIIQGVLIATILALLRFVQTTARPRVEFLGRVAGMPGFHSLARHAAGEAPAGIVIVRFNGPLVFFNAGHFRRAVLAAVDRPGPRPASIVLDLIPISAVDVTGLFAVQELLAALGERGIRLAAAGRQTEWHHWLERRGFPTERLTIYPTLDEAVEALGGAVPDAR